MKKHRSIARMALAALAVLFLLPCLLLALPLAGEPLDALWAAVTSPDYLQGYRNTLALAAGGMALQIAAALRAGYVLARRVSRRVSRPPRRRPESSRPRDAPELQRRFRPDR